MLHTNTSGGRIRFKTDSPYVAISVVFNTPGHHDNFAMIGYAGFDLYDGTRYIRTFRIPKGTENKYESLNNFPYDGLKDVTINMPLYSDVSELYIGLDENAVIQKADPYINDKPVVYYGSSVTQGGCASRPGSCYPALISRRFNCDYINLGFSGNAKGEPEIAEYIKTLDMSIFVLDYDFNAPSVEHLKNTHENFYKTIRIAHPDLPIIMMTRPKFYLTEKDKEYIDVIKKTYDNAVASGDKNVYILLSDELMAICGNDGTVDSIHPSDYGFVSMASALGDLIEKNNLFKIG